MPERLYIDSINDIINSMQHIKEFTADFDYYQFEKDFKTQYAVIRCFEIIGEAVKRLPLEFRENYTEIPWAIMAGMRDRLIHGYDMVDIGVVWRTIKTDIEPLFKQINSITNDFKSD